jgi:mRNA interferase RelE/StbE
MAAYTVEIRPAFRRELGKLPKPVQSEVIETLEALESNPFHDGFRKVEGNRCVLYRVRVSKYYRVIYAVEEEKLIVLAVRVGPRKDVYRRFS